MLNTRELPRIYEPLEELTRTFLPHLAFRKIDFENEEIVRCVFVRTDVPGVDEVELDDLSSGEKSILLLFLPLIEDEIVSRLRALGGDGVTEPAQEERLFLIDEVEQHLHPELQARLLGYLRDKAARGQVQFIVTTHSPTLVDQASDSELFMLDFARADGRNQLRRVASTSQRLEAIRALTGSTYVVTTGRSIVFVEGELEDESKGPTDAGVLQILHPSASKFTFVPIGGKGNVQRVVPALRTQLREEDYGIKVFGLVDGDREGANADGVVAWSVASIENLLLLNTQAIATCASGLLGRDVGEDEILRLLREVAEAERDEEIRLRVMEAIGARTIRIKALTVEELSLQLEEARKSLNIGLDQREKIVQDTTDYITTAMADGTFVRKFRGKKLLRGLYQRLGLPAKQVAYTDFVYSLARVAAGTEQVEAELDAVFASLQ